MIRRHLEKRLLHAADTYPVVSITGPRQSGKTTLVRKVFKNTSYVSLENPQEQEFALSDPQGFLAQFTDRVILDEIQRAPKLFSYIQGIGERDYLVAAYAAFLSSIQYRFHWPV